MKELIQKLAEESGLDARTMGFQNHHTEQWNARVSKLAELIVRECMNVADASQFSNEGYPVGLAIQEHFGVEE
jgi:hypothetical protein